MATQHRRYRLKPGVVDEFVALWADQVVPVRERFGFRVEGAWASHDEDVFVWLVAHDGDFAAAEKEYYEAPERSAISPDPAQFIEHAEAVMVTPASYRQ